MEEFAQKLSFAALEGRIQKMPDGPTAILNTPPGIARLDLIGTCAIVVGLLPFLLVQWLEPELWMVWMARGGMWCALLAYAPGFVRRVWVVAAELWRWKPKLVEQSDHDIAEFRKLRLWLCAFSRESLEEHRNFASLARERLTSKLGLLVGGVDRVGVLPVLAALFLLMREVDGLGVETLLDMPAWQTLLGLFLAITYVIGVVAVRMRLLFDLYEKVLADAIAHIDSGQTDAGEDSGAPVATSPRPSPEHGSRLEEP